MLSVIRMLMLFMILLLIGAYVFGQFQNHHSDNVNLIPVVFCVLGTVSLTQN